MLWSYMGDKKRMDNRSDKIVLYSLQTNIVKDIIKKDGICFSKKEYVIKKYEESSAIFVTIYNSLVQSAINYLDKPKGAEYPYFAFKDLYNIEYTSENLPLKLEVPLSEVLLFDVADYNKLLTFDYLSNDDNDYNLFYKEIDSQGLSTYKIMTSNFYPIYKSKIINSWKHIFDKNDELKKGNYNIAKQGVQAFLWCIKKEWVTENL